MDSSHMPERLARRRDEAGQALVEYALILGLVSIVCIASLTALGTNVNTILQSIATAIAS
jgi:Flp pilus assembly pilin Flp